MGAPLVLRHWTLGVLVGVIALLVGWDVLVVLDEGAEGHGGTISAVTLAFAQRHPVLPFVLGVVCGHLLWPQYRDRGGS